MNKWIPRLFYKKHDGGPTSGVVGYFLIEWKPFFSIGILRFGKGSREAYHSHAFNAITWFIWGNVTEEKADGTTKDFGPSLIPKYTPKENIHKVIAHETTYAITIRGGWEDYWYELQNDKKLTVVYTHGRKIDGMMGEMEGGHRVYIPSNFQEITKGKF